MAGSGFSRKEGRDGGIIHKTAAVKFPHACFPKSRPENIGMNNLYLSLICGQKKTKPQTQQKETL